jgi:hypothetical protein
MPPNSVNVELGILKERIKNYEDRIISLDSKVDRNSSSYSELFTKLESRIIALEVKNGEQKTQIGALLDYQKESNKRITKLEQWKWASVGGITVIGFLFTVLIGLILKGYVCTAK